MDYLTKFPTLAALLPGICARVREAFGPERRLSLEVYKDLEIEDRYLVLYVGQDQGLKKTWEEVEKVRCQFEDLLCDVPGDFLISVDHRR